MIFDLIDKNKNDSLKFAQECLDLINKSDNNEVKTLCKEFKIFMEQFKTQPKLTISFVGQYNAGKSSLIVALTEAKFYKRDILLIDEEEKIIDIYKIQGKDINVGPQILTDQTTTYEWKDVLIIDTPGVYTGKQDHDKKTFDEINNSDLIVFVVSNQLFDPVGGEFFKKLAYTMKREKQMLLVINKMSTEDSEKESLIKSLYEVTKPNKVEDFHTCFVDAQDYINYIKEEDDEDKAIFLKKSNFSEIYDSLKKIIEENKYKAKILTPLNKITSILEESRNILASSNNNEKNLLEMGRRRKIIIMNLKTKLKNLLSDLLNDLIHDIKMKGEEIISLIDSSESQKQVEDSLQEMQNFYIKDKIKGFSSNVENIIDNYKKTVSDNFKDEIENSHLFKSFCQDVIYQLGELAIFFPETNFSYNFSQEKHFDLNILSDKIKLFQYKIDEYIESQELEAKKKAQEISTTFNKGLKEIAILGMTFALPPQMIVPINNIIQDNNLILDENSLNKEKSILPSTIKVVKNMVVNENVATTITNYATKYYIDYTLKNASTLEKLSYSISESLYLKISGVGQKLTWLSKIGPALSVIGVFLDLYAQYKENEKDNNYQEKLREAKISLRTQISDMANDLRKNYNENINDYLKIYDEESNITEDISKEIIQKSKNNNDFIQEINNKINLVNEKIKELKNE